MNISGNIPANNVTSMEGRTAAALAQAGTTGARQLNANRVKAEEVYQSALAQSKSVLESLESEVANAPNTKREIKEGIKDLGKSLRDLFKNAATIGLTRSPDAIEAKLQAIQVQQRKQNVWLEEKNSQWLRQEGNLRTMIETMSKSQQEQQSILLNKIEEIKYLQNQQGEAQRASEGATLAQIGTMQGMLTQAVPQLPSVSLAPVKKNQRVETRQPPQQEQAAPQRQSEERTQSSEWTTVTNRKKPRGEDNMQQTRKPAKTTRKANMADKVRKKIPKFEAVTIADPAGEETYTSIMSKVTSSVNLQELGINISNTRRTKTGSILLEVEGKKEAEKLTHHLQQVIGTTARVGRPSRTTPVLLLDVPDWVDEQEVTKQIKACDPDLAGVEITLKRNTGGGTVAQFRARMETAVKLAELRSIKIGWSLCRIKLLEPRPPVCYRCQERGHMAARCLAPEVARKCYRCQSVGHEAAACQQQAQKPRKEDQAVTPSGSTPSNGELPTN